MNEWADRLSIRAVTVIVGLITVSGFALRANLFGDSVFGDELSTLWIVENHSFTETVSVVHGDAEITPPLYFMLAWLSTHLGSSPELVRLPALITGTLAIPMTYMFGLRTLGRATGIAAALVIALSPYMTFLSAYGRGYALMIFFLLGSALALLAAVRTGRLRWWVAYAACCCLAMYSHYTAAFVLVAQFGWVLWAYPAVRRPSLFAVAGAAILYIPWLTGVLSDLDSPTQAVLEFLQGKGIDTKVKSITQMIAGEPMVDLSKLPGRFGLILIGAGLVIGLVGTILSLALWKGDRFSERRRMFALVLMSAGATLFAELILLALGTDLLSDRNLSATWAFLPVLIGALLAMPPLRIGAVAALATIAGFTIGAMKTADRTVSGTAYEKAAGFIEGSAGPGDVVLDMSHYTPVPLTQLDAYLSQDLPEFRVDLPQGEPPFLPGGTVVLPRERVIADAFRRAVEGRVFVVTREVKVTDANLIDNSAGLEQPPRGWTAEQVKTWPGFVPVTVTVFERSPASARGSG